MAELHYGQYPYPEEFVFLVTGGEVVDGAFNLAELKPFVIVGRTPESVKKEWHDLCHGKDNWVPMACLSMSQLSKFRSAMCHASLHPESYTKIPPATMSSGHGLDRAPWIITMLGESNDSIESMVVLARSAEDIVDWSNKKNLKLATALSMPMVDGTWEEMNKAKNGRAELGWFAREDSDWTEHYAQFKGEVGRQKLDARIARVESEMRNIGLMSRN